MLILFFFSVFCQIIHANAQLPAVKSKPLVAIRQPITARATVPSWQLNPSTIDWPPDCATLDLDSCFGITAISKCTVKTCAKKVALTCWHHVYYIDIQCLCNDMNIHTCPTCTGGINRELYLAWLAAYCPLSPTWEGLPGNWSSAFPGYEILEAGQVKEVSKSNSSVYQSENPYTMQFSITDMHSFMDNRNLPTCTSGCDWLNNKWNVSYVDGYVAAALDAANVFPAKYNLGGPPKNGTLYIDLSEFCTGWSWNDLQSKCTGMCSTNVDPTSLLLWLNTTCGQVTGFNGLPNHWEDSLALVNSSYSDVYSGSSCITGSKSSGCQIDSVQSSCTKTLCNGVDQKGDCDAVPMVNKECFCPKVDFSNCTTTGGPCSSSADKTGLLVWLNGTCSGIHGFAGMPDHWEDSISMLNKTYSKANSFPWPSCLKAGNHTDCQLNSTETSCVRTVCSDVDSHGSCNSTDMISMQCFCSQVKYGSSCSANCGLSWERAQYLNWLNNTCFSKVDPGISLPLNWTSLLPVQRSEMLPWKWQLSSDISPSGEISNPQVQCPSASSKLLAFAAVNIAMLLLMPIISRRTVIKKLTCRFFGRQESKRWYITGPIGVGLHLASNAVNAAIIKSTAGFQHTDIKTFTIFWCTRPRISWLIVGLLPIDADRSMYLASTASILFSEVILQLISSYYMGLGANYARRQKFLLNGHLGGTWYARQAKIMYAGSIVWLIAVPFAIGACLWTALEVSDWIGQLGRYWVERAKVAKINAKFATTHVTELRASKNKIGSVGQAGGDTSMEDLHNKLLVAIDTTIGEWAELKTTWERMPTEIRKEHNQRRKVKKELQTANERLERSKTGEPEWEKRWQNVRTAQLRARAVEDQWLTTTPEEKQNNARVHQERIDHELISYDSTQSEVNRLLLRYQREILPFENAIADIKSRIEANKAEKKRIEATQKSLRPDGDQRAFNDLKERRRVNLQQGPVLDAELKNVECSQEYKRKLERIEKVQSLLDSWGMVIKQEKALEEQWDHNKAEWRAVAVKRREENTTKPSVKDLPWVVILGMLLCWIAQWLWWAGYVGVAGDGYCPPKLPALASIWTSFSSFGKSPCLWKLQV